MAAFTEFWNELMAYAVFAGILASVILFYALLFPKTKFGTRVSIFVSAQILWFGFLISLAATIGSLVYSNVIGYAPCLLCWYLRIAFYPQVLLFAMALRKQDRKIIDYALGLSVFGLIVSIYHVISENIGSSVISCDASGPSCLTRYVYEYGFITIPVMGLVSLLTLFLALLIAKKSRHTNTP